MRPFEHFIEQALRDFEDHLKAASLSAESRRVRLQHARDFAIFLIGRPIPKPRRRRTAD